MLTKQDLKKAVRLAEKEIKEWQKFLDDMGDKLAKLEKPKRPDWLCKWKKCTSCRDWEKKVYQPRLQAWQKSNPKKK